MSSEDAWALQTSALLLHSRPANLAAQLLGFEDLVNVAAELAWHRTGIIGINTYGISVRI